MKALNSCKTIGKTLTLSIFSPLLTIKKFPSHFLKVILGACTCMHVWCVCMCVCVLCVSACFFCLEHQNNGQVLHESSDAETIRATNAFCQCEYWILTMYIRHYFLTILSFWVNYAIGAIYWRLIYFISLLLFF